MSSRIRLTNLPKQVTARRLKDHFACCGEITDCALLRTKDGRNVPRMAFIGFKDPEMAAQAVAKFHRTFLDTTRIAVDLAKKVEGPPAGPSGKGGSGSGGGVAGKAAETADPAAASPAVSEVEDLKKDPRYLEFLSVVKHKQTGAWANDMPDGQFMDLPPPAEELPTSASGAEEQPPPQDLTEEEFAAKQQRLNALSDLDFLKSLKTGAGPDTGDEHKQTAPAPPVAEAAKSAEGRLYITNLPFTASEEDLEKELQKYGSVQSVRIPIVRQTKQSKGVAFVQFATQEAADAAREALHQNSFQGRLLKVTPAMAQPEAVELQWSDSYKAKKALKDKQDRENAKRWGSLYINANTVVETIAKRLNVDKDRLVGPDQDNAAVRVAIAESVLTSEAAQVLSDEGIDLTALNDKKRENSKTTIIVKNLPASGGAKDRGDVLADLTRLFRNAGDINRVVAPEGTTIVLIEFMEAADARKAFSKYAYHKFNDVPLYLEWAPLGVLPQRRRVDPSADDEEQLGNEEAATLYVANLPFSATEHTVKAVLFKKYAEAIRSFSHKQAKGFAFVEFKDHATAVQAYKGAVGTEMDGRLVSISFAKSRQETPAAVGKKGQCPPGANPLKLVVRNVPFEATAADIRKLFGAHAQIKSVRLPKKVDEYDPLTGTKKPIRGFAFVEFLTQEEARLAMQACGNTHLYGRHLVVEWATDTTSVDALREKAKRKSLADLPPKAKKMRLGEGD